MSTRSAPSEERSGWRVREDRRVQEAALSKWKVLGDGRPGQNPSGRLERCERPSGTDREAHREHASEVGQGSGWMGGGV